LEPLGIRVKEPGIVGPLWAAEITAVFAEQIRTTLIPGISNRLWAARKRAGLNYRCGTLPRTFATILGCADGPGVNS
jgi:hypothetical protein